MWLEREKAKLEAQIGMPIVVRGIHAPDPALRGRIVHKIDRIVLEYRDDNAGYFWHIDILREMFEMLGDGVFEAVLRDDDMHYRGTQHGG
ncbi:MAG: hypothetical protein R6V19_07640 [Armatimonadota bacterium]